MTVHGDVTKRSAPPGVRCGRTHNIGPPLCISWRPATDTIGLLLDLRTRGQSVFTDRMEPLAPSPDAAADADAAAAAADSPVDVRMRRPTLSERRYGTRVARLLLGLVLCGLGIAVMVAADLGLGPWDVLHQGISGFVPLEIGAVGIVVGFVVLALWIPLKERPGIGTILNVIVIGVVIDTVLLWLDTPDTMAARIALLLSGPLLFGVGSGFYIGARIGTGPRDGLMTGLAKRGWPVGPVRTGIELVALTLGWLLGGTAGAGTLLFALTIGPVVAYCLPRLEVSAALDDPRPA